jgi:hypothetical protein
LNLHFESSEEDEEKFPASNQISFSFFPSFNKFKNDKRKRQMLLMLCVVYVG